MENQLPQCFELDYVGADGEMHRPIMLHRVVFGSIDRFMGIIIEHYAGKFLAWLAPVKARYFISLKIPFSVVVGEK